MKTVKYWILVAALVLCGATLLPVGAGAVASEPKQEAKVVSEVQRRIDVEKWSEGKAIMGTIATAIRAYVAEMNRDIPAVIPVPDAAALGFMPGDLSGNYFTDTNFSWTVTYKMATNALMYTITADAPAEISSPKQVRLIFDSTTTPPTRWEGEKSAKIRLIPSQESSQPEVLRIARGSMGLEIAEVRKIDVSNPVDLEISPEGDFFVLCYDYTSGKCEVQLYEDLWFYVKNPDLVTPISIVVDAVEPGGMACAGGDRIYVADTGGHRILRYSAGLLDTMFGNKGVVGEYGSGEGQFKEPQGIDVDYKGNIYVTDTGNSCVQVFDEEGKFITKWGTSGAGNGQLNNPSKFCLLPAADYPQMILADMGNNRIQRLCAWSGYFWDKTGQKGKQAGTFESPCDVYYDLGFDQIAVVDLGNNRIQFFQLSSSSDLGANYGMVYDDQIEKVPGVSPDSLKTPKAVACKSSEIEQIVYIADTGNKRILKVKRTFDNAPVEVWKAFIAALRAEDVDKALTFIAEPSRETYAELFQANKAHIQSLVDAMSERELVLVSREWRFANYAVLIEEEGQVFGFPVHFIRGFDGSWKVLNY